MLRVVYKLLLQFDDSIDMPCTLQCHLSCLLHTIRCEKTNFPIETAPIGSSFIKTLGPFCFAHSFDPIEMNQWKYKKDQINSPTIVAFVKLYNEKKKINHFDSTVEKSVPSHRNRNRNVKLIIQQNGILLCNTWAMA